jgi:hypothetical protein
VWTHRVPINGFYKFSRGEPSNNELRTRPGFARSLAAELGVLQTQRNEGVMPAGSIQEGGCTTPPGIPLAKLGDPNVLPAIALLSPVFVVAATWATGKILAPGIASLSVTLRVAVLTVALAVVVSGVAMWRAKDPESKMLSVIGLVGNTLLVAGGAAYLWLR